MNVNSQRTADLPNAKQLGQLQDVGLSLRSVTKRFGSTIAVNNISLTANRGEVHALLGENGAGKSTMMAMASGGLSPDEGTVSICGNQVEALSVSQALNLGLAIVHQHPAVLPDLTVRENLLLAVPPNLRSSETDTDAWAELQLKRVGATINLNTQARHLNFVQLQLVELAKAFAIDPKVLILDEPTAALTSDLVDILFQNIRELRGRGCAIIYISHRLKEVREVADVVTVIRDGTSQVTSPIEALSDDDILRFIVGREVKNVFPPKLTNIDTDIRFEANGVSGEDFEDISISVRAGEIIGLAGIAANGQNEFLRAIAGLELATGIMRLDGNQIPIGKPSKVKERGIVFLSSDRPNEGAFLRQSVRENASIAALDRFSNLGFISRKSERTEVQDQMEALSVKAASIENPISTLSGGNQQKVILARALLSKPSLVLAEEPTAGVDVGARADIYEILRELASQGMPVIVMSSDLVELEGLCDRVYVFSRGQIVSELKGQDVTEEKIGYEMVTASGERERQTSSSTGLRRFDRLLSGTYTPTLVLGAIILALTLYVTGQNARFLSAFNIEKVLFLSGALAFVGFGQLFAILIGRIDLSVGPLVGLVVVIASFHFGQEIGAHAILTGLTAIAGAAIVVGFVNGSLVWLGKLSAVAVTLGVYILIQGTSVLLRPYPDGVIGATTMDTIQSKAGVFPTFFLAAVLTAIVLELILQRSRTGMALRAVGSDENAARQIGTPAGLYVVGAFVASSICTAIGGFIVVGQLGIGDPNQGVEYTLASIAAVVLGGASLMGGRGSFLGVLLGTVLIQVSNSSMVFLGLSQAWQFWFIGGLTLGAVALYSKAEKSG